jgi:hypothetical protein
MGPKYNRRRKFKLLVFVMVAVVAGWFVLGVAAICACAVGARAEARRSERGLEDTGGTEGRKSLARAAMF